MNLYRFSGCDNLKWSINRLGYRPNHLKWKPLNTHLALWYRVIFDSVELKEIRNCPHLTNMEVENPSTIVFPCAFFHLNVACLLTCLLDTKFADNIKATNFQTQSLDTPWKWRWRETQPNPTNRSFGLPGGATSPGVFPPTVHGYSLQICNAFWEFLSIFVLRRSRVGLRNPSDVVDGDGVDWVDSQGLHWLRR